MKKQVLAVMTLAAVLGACAPAAAETFTAENGVLSIELPGENWKEMTDPTKWIVLSDGSNEITIEHFSNGEKLPEVTVADSHYVNVYQAVFSTQNEVFMVTGSVVDAAKIPDVANAIMSLKVLKYDTKLKVKQDAEVKVSDFSVVATDKTMYVASDGLNVRMGCSTDDQIIGGLSYGTAVRVTGVVQRGGEDYGWYVIDFNGGTGYVSSGFLTDQQPETKADDKNVPGSGSYTGNACTVYAMDGTAVTIYEKTTGVWYDNNGTAYNWVGDYTLTNEGGDSFTTYPTTGEAYFTGNTTTVYSLTGVAVTIRESTDGYWYTDSGARMNWLDAERLESEGGEAFLSYYPFSDPNATEEQVQCEYCGQWFPAGNLFRNHVCPARDAAMAAGN